MRILVIDDYLGNIATAHDTLVSFDYSVCTTVQEAYDILNSDEKFDAVLTDLFMPLGSFRGGMRQYESPDYELPAGLVFALKAIDKGARCVICTDANHHTDRICSLLDLIYKNDLKKGGVVAYVEARSVAFKGYWDDSNKKLVRTKDWCGNGERRTKDWLSAMRRSEIFPELGDS